MQRQLGRVVDHQASLEVPGSKLNDDVHHVDNITGDVRDKPASVATALEIWKSFAGNARPQVVQHVSLTPSSQIP